MLDRADNYCPQCGQENDDKNVSANILFSEFIGTYLSLDSSFFKSLKPFLLKPGYLTNQFNSGKHRSFANPVRLYLIMSVFYFFMGSIFGMKVVSDDDPNKKGESFVEFNQDENDSLSNYMSATERDSVFSNLDKIPERWDSDKLTYKVNKDSSDIIVNRLDWNLINDLKNNDDYSDQDILDSMKLGKLTFSETYLARQIIRINKSDTESVLKFLFQNLPLMMLVVIPLFALLLKLVYYRRKTLYVKHIIHALHLHSFAYLIYGVGLFLFVYTTSNENIQLIIWLIGYLIVLIYALISFKKVYLQGFFKTFVKFLLVGTGYFMLVFLFFLMEAALSFLLY